VNPRHVALGWSMAASSVTSWTPTPVPQRWRRIADTLKRLTEDAAAATGCGLVRAADASVDHHAWSDLPWTTRFGLPVPGRVAPLHPNAAGMRAVADLVVAALT
jgi:hypothetical protein